MNLSALFIKRPVTTTLIMLGILVFGTMAYRTLPVSDLPTIDFPTIQVNASLPGASPETMASTVALPLEKQFASIAGLTNINSVSQQGSTNITLQFDLSRNIDAAAQDVQAMIGRASRALPPQMPAPPSYQKSNPGDQSTILLVLRSATLPMSLIDEYAQQTIAQRISMLSGVASVDVFGSQKNCRPWTSIRVSSRRARSASTMWPARLRPRTPTCPPERSTARKRSSCRPTGS